MNHTLSDMPTLLKATHLNPSATWGEAFLAGLPHLLYPLVVYNYIYSSQPGFLILSYPISATAATFWLIIMGGLLWASREKWPRWSGTWIGYGLILAVELLIVLPTTGTEVFTWLALLTGLLWFILYITVTTLTAWRDQLQGFLTVLPLILMWYSVLALDGVGGNEAPIFLADGVIVAFLVALIVRRGTLRLGLELILLMITLVGLPIAYATTYFSNMPSPPDPTPLAVLWGYLIYFVAFALFSAPIWLVGLWQRLKPSPGNNYSFKKKILVVRATLVVALA